MPCACMPKTWVSAASSPLYTVQHAAAGCLTLLEQDTASKACMPCAANAQGYGDGREDDDDDDHYTNDDSNPLGKLESNP